MTRYRDRTQAGQALAEEVAPLLTGERPVVLALPRGGVPVAAPVAERTGGVLDVLVTGKVPAPGRPELGVGALAEDGPVLFDEGALHRLRLRPADLDGAVETVRAEVARRVRVYRGDRALPPLTGRVVVVVDDGVATGVSAWAALCRVRDRSPARLVMAAPVCSRQARELLAAVADDVVVPLVPRSFVAVGHWYADFGQLTDDAVTTALGRSR